jgi:hypothetical protein
MSQPPQPRRNQPQANQPPQQAKGPFTRLSDQENQRWKDEVEGTPFAMGVLKHWREFRPKMCRGLDKQNLLYKSVMSAAVMTCQLMESLWKEGLSEDKAQEIAYPQWYLLPDEQEQPSLTFNPSSLPEAPPTSD